MPDQPLPAVIRFQCDGDVVACGQHKPPFWIAGDICRQHRPLLRQRRSPGLRHSCTGASAGVYGTLRGSRAQSEPSGTGGGEITPIMDNLFAFMAFLLLLLVLVDGFFVGYGQGHPFTFIE